MPRARRAAVPAQGGQVPCCCCCCCCARGGGRGGGWGRGKGEEAGEAGRGVGEGVGAAWAGRGGGRERWGGRRWERRKQGALEDALVIGDLSFTRTPHRISLKKRGRSSAARKGKEKTPHREQVPVTPRELRRIDDGQAADPALCRDVAQAGLAPRAAVPARLELAVAGAHGRVGRVHEGGEPHLHEVGRRRR